MRAWAALLHSRCLAACRALSSAKGVTSLYVMGAIERDNGWGDVDTDSADPAVRDALDLAVRHGLVLPPTTARLPGADPAAEHAQLQRLLAGQYTGERRTGCWRALAVSCADFVPCPPLAYRRSCGLTQGCQRRRKRGVRLRLL